VTTRLEIIWCDNPADKLSAYFSAGEFRCKDEIDAPSPWPVATDLVALLQAMRDRLGKAITITSGYRTPEHNIKVGGAISSKHLIGAAADIKVKGVAPRELAWLAWSLGCRRIGVSGTFCHVDVAPGEAIWVYSGDRKAPAELVDFIKGWA
jgi:hypothetical protein